MVVSICNIFWLVLHTGFTAKRVFDSLCSLRDKVLLSKTYFRETAKIFHFDIALQLKLEHEINIPHSILFLQSEYIVSQLRFVLG